MSAVTLFTQSALAGLAIAAPIGPIGMLCLQRTIRQGPAHGMATGLGVASADACHALLAALGAGAVGRLLLPLAPWLALAGAGCLIWMGYGSFCRQRQEAACARGASSLWSSWASALALTMSNPLTILSFLALFMQLAGRAAPGIMESGLMVAGIFTGSTLWWLLLTQGFGRLLLQLGQAVGHRLQQLCGLILMGMGAWLGAMAAARLAL
ncbi:LysE family translocator [Paludibacterium yongneupense]|uniref:LysE family translocator n=1 Tax=Paludibacterium yongneupense TaxID=400061 RepID=UPI0003F65722|nr:LysE family transporter [Paludibacterium yongneupense]